MANQQRGWAQNLRRRHCYGSAVNDAAPRRIGVDQPAAGCRRDLRPLRHQPVQLLLQHSSVPGRCWRRAPRIIRDRSWASSASCATRKNSGRGCTRSPATSASNNIDNEHANVPRTRSKPARSRPWLPQPLNPSGQPNSSPWSGRATAGLSDVDRSVLELNIRHELDGEELAEEPGLCPGPKCSVILHRAKDRLKTAGWCTDCVQGWRGRMRRPGRHRGRSRVQPTCPQTGRTPYHRLRCLRRD